MDKLNDVTKELGNKSKNSDNEQDSNAPARFEPNSKIDPAQVWYDGRQQGPANDTSTHPEKFYNRKIYRTDSSGRVIDTLRYNTQTHRTDTSRTKNY